jgi:glycosyltransferase involved in cell wall biosynthesis
MGDSLGVVGEGLPEDARPLLKARPEPEHTVADLARNVAAALEQPRAHADALRAIAEARFDWRAIAARLAEDLEGLGRGA